MKDKITKYIKAMLSGLANGVFGAGGGILAVNYFSADGNSQKKAQATATAAILIMSLLSSIFYLYKGYFSIYDSLKFIPAGIAGSLTGGILLRKVPDKILKRIFALFIIYTGTRMLLK